MSSCASSSSHQPTAREQQRKKAERAATIAGMEANARINELTSKVDILQVKNDGLAEELAVAKERLKSQGANVDQPDDRVDEALQRTLQNHSRVVSNTFHNLEAAQSAVDSHLTTISQKILNLRADIDKRFRDLDEEHLALTVEVDSRDSAFHKFEQVLRDLSIWQKPRPEQELEGQEAVEEDRSYHEGGTEKEGDAGEEGTRESETGSVMVHSECLFAKIQDSARRPVSDRSSNCPRISTKRQPCLATALDPSPTKTPPPSSR
ncbi:MAG: hypothetical protein L6R39_002585 [Caloplaca ligustica]|nr:MAG: hypothetical protein L6R39_002585 [Caloplaca ligustica]